MAQTKRTPEQDIFTCLSFYHPPGSTFEVRVKGVTAGKYQTFSDNWIPGGIIVGYFDNPSIATAAIVSVEQEMEPLLIMMSSNPLKQACLGRANNCFSVDAKASTEKDVSHSENLICDFDAQTEVSGVPSSDPEKQKTTFKGVKCNEDLTEEGFDGLLTDSGNGCHLTVKTEHLTVSEARELIPAVTKVISENYSDQDVIVDTSVASPGHMIRVAGTMNRKGANIPERPHRLSFIISEPSTITPMPKAKLVEIANVQTSDGEEKTETILPSIAKGSLSSPRLNVKAWLDDSNVEIVKTKKDGDTILYVLAKCPFDSSHGQDAVIGQRADGTPIFYCFHNSCSPHLFVDAQRQISGQKSLRPFLEGGDPGFEPTMGSVISMHDVLHANIPESVSLIEKIVGPGEVTIISGPGGVGKSLLTMNAALAIGSSGLTNFLDLNISNANTLMVQTENAIKNTQDRLRMMVQDPGMQMGLKNVSMCSSTIGDVRTIGIDLTKDSWLDRLYQDILSTQAELLVLDPLISANPADENDNSHMRRMMDRVTYLVTITKVAVIIIHHVGRGFNPKSEVYVGRGASSVGDWCDNSFLLRVSDAKAATIELSCQKARNFKKPSPIHMKLNNNLVFERIYQKGNNTNFFLQKVVVRALQHLGGIAKTQNELKDAMLKIDSKNINKTKARNIINDAVADGAIVENTKGRSKTYELPAPPQQVMGQSGTDTALITQ